MKKIYSIASILACSLIIISCNQEEKTDEELFEEILNDPRINSKEVGESEGLKYFQIMEDGKTGCRDLDGNIVIEPKNDNAEMFSEGFSTVSVGDQYGIIDEKGEFVLPLQNFEYLGSIHNGLASFRVKGKYGFVDIKGNMVIKPQFDWVDDFSTGFCVFRNSQGKHGYIDTTGKIAIPLQYEFAYKFEDGIAKVQSNKLWGSINVSGKIVEPITHQYASW